MTPIFLLSLPRSGSTLLQRILAMHDEISTTAEPWVLLPLLSARKKSTNLAVYDHDLAANALSAFCDTLPNGDKDFDDAIKEFALGIYKKQANTAYFLDKTPRYSIVAPNIAAIFSDAKFIFLWRNPLAILASMIETWGQGRWVLFRYYIDLYDGLDGLLAARARLGEAAIDVQFETLVTDKKANLDAVLRGLGISALPKGWERSEIPFIGGAFGDPGPGRNAREIQPSANNSWHKTLCNPLRRRWCRRYLRRLGASNLTLMGYEMDTLIAEIDALPISTRYLVRDCIAMIYGTIYRRLNLPAMRRTLFRKNSAAYR